MREEQGANAVPDDANDLRGFHFRRLLRRPATWIVTPIAVVAAAGGGAALVGPAIGAAAAGAVFLLALLVVFAIADSRAEGAFFDAYASERGMALAGKGPLPPSTPLLRKGSDRYAVRTLSGPLGAGVDGVLALYTYEEKSTDGEQTQYYGYTLGMVDVPECAGFLSELICQRKLGPRALEKLEDAFRGSKQRVELESAALDERYEIFTGKEQDQVWLRRLFSPTFIVWLGEEAPEKFAFELVGGSLCCYVSGHKKKAAELDTIRAASAAVATRLREEAREGG
jgi:hypothetical protein